MEPFAVIIGGTPEPFFIHGTEPLVVAFFEFGNGVIPDFLQRVQVKLQIMSFDGFPGFLSFHRNTKTVFVGF
jgi:hypothetical protein